MIRTLGLLTFLLVFGFALAACQSAPVATTSTSVPAAASQVALLPTVDSARAAETRPSETLEQVASPTVFIAATATNTPSPTPTATPEPTVTRTPTATAEMPIVAIHTSGTNVRLGPGTGYGIVEKQTAGQQLEVTGQIRMSDGIWWRVKTKDGQIGYIREDVVEENVAVAGVPVVEKKDLPPTPTPAPEVEQVEPTTGGGIVVGGEYVLARQVGATRSEKGSHEEGSVSAGKKIKILGVSADGKRWNIKTVPGGAVLWISKTAFTESAGGSTGSGGTVGGRTELRKIGAYIEGGDVVEEYALGYWAGMEVNHPGIPEANRLKPFICADIQTIDYRSGLVTVLVQYEGQERILQANASGAGFSLRTDIIYRIPATIWDFAPDDNVRLYFGDLAEMQNWASGNDGVARLTGMEGAR